MNSILKSILKRIYKDRYDEVAGDFQELHTMRLEARGKVPAYLMMLRDLLLALRNIALPSREVRQAPDQLPTIVRHGIRRFLKKPIWSLSNLLSLGLAISVFLFLQGYIHYQKNFDSHLTNSENLCRIDYRLLHRGTELSFSAASPPTIAPFAQSVLPVVEDYARVHYYPGLTFRQGDRIFREDEILMVDPAFIRLFDVTLVAGNPTTALSDRGAMIISQTTKEKYFGQAEAVGKIMSIDGYSDYKITGVFEDAPKNTHLPYDILLSFETARWWYEDETETDWTSGTFHSYLQVAQTTNLTHLTAKLQAAYKESPQGQVDQDKDVDRIYTLRPVTDIHLSPPMERQVAGGGNSTTLNALNIISFLILLVALFNYSSLLSTRVFTRSREIGLRKVLGARKFHLVMQFLAEALALQLLAMSLAVLLVVMVRPYASDFFGYDWEISQLLDAGTLLTLGTFPLIAFVMAGLFPAFYLSSFPALSMLAGKITRGSNGVFIRNAFMVFQFSTTTAIIMATVIAHHQLRHLQQKDVGIDLQKSIALTGPEVGDAPSNAFRMELLKNPKILSVGAGANVPGTGELELATLAKKVASNAQFIGLPSISVGYDYLKSLDVTFLAGRDHDRSIRSDTAGIILNESALQKMGFADARSAVGAEMIFGSGYEARVIGVIADYDQRSAKHASMPIVFWLYPEEYVNYIIRFTHHDAAELIPMIEAVYAKLYPDDPFEYYHLEDLYVQQYRSDTQFLNAFFFFSLIALLIAGFGLLAIISWQAGTRKKEFTIRKVLGARFREILALLSKESLLLITLSILLASPLTYGLMNDWLADYAYRISIQPQHFLVPGVLLLVLASVAIAINLTPNLKENPVEGLREE